MWIRVLGVLLLLGSLTMTVAGCECQRDPVSGETSCQGLGASR